MKTNFEHAIARLFESEGGYVDDPADRGGPTKYGITLPTLAEQRGRPVTKADLIALTCDEAAVVYRDLYWAKIQGDDLPSGVDYAVFDAAVHSGPRQAARWLQDALGGSPHCAGFQRSAASDAVGKAALTACAVMRSHFLAFRFLLPKLERIFLWSRPNPFFKAEPYGRTSSVLLHLFSR